MLNRIRNVAVVDHRLDPHESELRIRVGVEFVTPTTEFKGRLVGPRCAGRSTVEIAYPMRLVKPVDLTAKNEPNEVEMRVVIPEPGLWGPTAPFFYEGPLELWQDGEICSRVTVRHEIGKMSHPMA